SLGFKWTASSPDDNATITACIGDKVTFPWEYTVDGDEVVLTTAWHQITDEEKALATHTSGDFFLSSTVEMDIRFLTNAGIEISNYTYVDFATYRVTVKYLLHGDLYSQSRSVVLALPDVPVVAGDRLVAHVQPEPVLDTDTGDRHVQLTCGLFMSIGRMGPESVVWTTPSGRGVPSTSYSNGRFHLRLPNPVVAGEYHCNLKNPSQAGRCVKNMLALRLGAHVTVDEVLARLMLLEGGVEILQDKDVETDSELKRQKEVDSSLQDELSEQKATDNQLISDVLRLKEGMSLQEETDNNHTSDITSLKNEMLLQKKQDGEILSSVNSLQENLVLQEKTDSNHTTDIVNLKNEILLQNKTDQRILRNISSLQEDLHLQENTDRQLSSDVEVLREMLTQQEEADLTLSANMTELREDLTLLEDEFKTDIVGEFLSNTTDLQEELEKQEKADEQLRSDVSDLTSIIQELERNVTSDLKTFLRQAVSEWTAGTHKASTCTKIFPGGVSVWPDGIPAEIGEKLTFSVKTCDDAWLHLTTYPKSDSRYTTRMYRVFIGYSGNTKSVIMYEPGSKTVAEHEHSPLDCGLFQRFYVSWDNGEVKVGTVKEPTGQAVTFNDPFLSYKPDDPIDVRYVTVLTGESRAVWRFDKTVCPYATTQDHVVTATEDGDTCVINLPGHTPIWPDTIPSGVGKSFIFAVKTCLSAYLYLTTHPNNHANYGDKMYEIWIGAWENTKSRLRLVRPDTTVDTHSHSPLDCASFRRFYVSWEGGEVKVGTVEESPDLRYIFNDPFLSHKFDDPIEVNYAYIDGWHDAAEWHIDDPTRTCDQQPVKRCPSSEWSKFQSSCYRVVKTKLSWTEAKDDCKRRDGTLAEIGTSEENEFAKGLAKKSGGGVSVWLGGTDSSDEGTWVWDASRRPVQFTEWADNEPNNWKGISSNGEDCLEIRYNYNFKWNDVTCSLKQYHLCEIL
ncbi:hypothetical protein BaRGS_00036941, partial [Batillaria attramentaria]